MSLSLLKTLQQPSYPMTSEDLLIMCLNPALKLPTTSQTTKFSIEQTMRLWAADPAVQCESHSPSATSGGSHTTDIEKVKETLVEFMLWKTALTVGFLFLTKQCISFTKACTRKETPGGVICVALSVWKNTCSRRTSSLLLTPHRRIVERSGT
ncbi:unnamed protein product [Strongylus vulgaris]|uniref:Uncharacterized protein n=1 Tax=Strongylus vulgaris TaxID=40348 RepID=A0A3P7J660_STRVU|nr:unnamed protein product [Strongylus vulgaris]